MSDWPKKMWMAPSGLIFPTPFPGESVEVFVYLAHPSESAIRDSERERCAKWLEGAQVDEQGRLILTRSYIAACIRELGNE